MTIRRYPGFSPIGNNGGYYYARAPTASRIATTTRSTAKKAEGLGTRSDREECASHSACSIRNQEDDDICQCVRSDPSIELRL
jgi:hypothetical protein